MEDTLRAAIARFGIIIKHCLNPCFNGRYSQRYYVKVVRTPDGRS